MESHFRPDPLTARQREIFAITAIVCALSRFVAMARTLWDYDENLFALGMRAYDVSNHQPHPPGFPVYIGLAKIMRLFADSDFHALQSVNLLAGMLLFPALFLFAREAGLEFETSFTSALLCSFFPNVVFFGGGAFSDIPSLALVVWACVFLLRGRDSRRDYWIGTLLLALAIGIRPQNLLVGLVPGLLATRRRKPVEVIVAVLIGLVVAGGAFAAAIEITGPARYLSAVRQHGEYISRIDSFRSPQRPPLWRLFDRFFIKQYQNSTLSIITTLLVIAGSVFAVRRRNRAIGLVVLTFLPFALFAWLMLDRFSTSRFSIGYCPMFAILAGYGLITLFARHYEGPALFGAIDRSRATGMLAGLVLVLAFFVWMVPSFEVVRRDVSPTVQAVTDLPRHVDPTRDELLVDYSMTRFVQYLQPDLHFHRVLDERALPLDDSQQRIWLLTETPTAGPGGFLYHRERDALWFIARRHFFEVVLRPLSRRATFGKGWFPPEFDGIDEWRWMEGKSITLLPPASGPTKLRLHTRMSDANLALRPTITVTLNGTVLGRVVAAEGGNECDFSVQPFADRPNVLELAIDRTQMELGQGGKASRTLGLSLRFLSFGTE